MPIEIRELVIKVNVEENSKLSSADMDMLEIKKTLIKEIKKEIKIQLKKEKER